MSKIFDGLKRTGGELADLTIGAMGAGAPSKAETAAPADQVRTRNGADPKANDTNDADGHGVAVEDEPRDDYRVPERGPEERYSTHHDPIDLEPVDIDTDWQQPSADENSDEGWPMTADPSKLAGSRSTTIRLQAGAPLFPFDTKEADRAAEEYRRVRTRILQHPLQPRLVLVSSPMSGDGKSVTTVNIGAALALNPDARVLLVDMDLRHPTISGLLDVPDGDGVAEILAGKCTLDDVIVRLEPFPNLFLLPAGKDRTSPTDLISSSRWQSLCDEFRAKMSYTILDAPPVDAVAEYSLLQERSDGLILVVRTDHTERSHLFSAIDSIPKEKLIGGVINTYRSSLFWRQRSGYYA